jgi:hypothetical protein
MMRSMAAALLALLLGGGAAMAGTLEIVTQPGVEVHWEGVHLATTDAEGRLVVEDVPPGPFELTLSKTGFEDLSTEVTIGDGTTRLDRQLRAVPGPTPSPPITPPPLQLPTESPPASMRASEPEEARPMADPPPAVPTVRLSRGAVLAALVVLGVVGALVLRSRRPTEVAAPSPEKRARRKPRVTREQPEAKTGGSFLHELRQRERALDELVDVSTADGRRAQVPEPDVVDVAWKEID